MAIATFHPASYDLACHFLDDVKGHTQSDRNQLAATIQQAVEDWLEDQDRAAAAAYDAHIDAQIDERRIEGKRF